MIPGWGIEITSPRAAVVAEAWYLSGGIAAANCIAAYTPKGAASLAASYDNNAAPGNGLADSTYDAAPGVAPTWASGTGWTFNGTTQYLDTGVIPAADQSWSLLVRYSGAVQSDFARFGCLNSGSARFFLYPYTVSSSGTGYGHGGYLLVPVSDTSGVIGFAGNQPYRNGATHGGTIGTGAGTPIAFSIGAVNNTSVIGDYWNGTIEAIAIYDTVLTAPQVAAVSTAMAAL